MRTLREILGEQYDQALTETFTFYHKEASDRAVQHIHDLAQVARAARAWG